MDPERLRRLSQLILADILSVGSVVSAGPALNAAQEAELLRAVEHRLAHLWPRHGQEGDAAIRDRFRREHPGLFTGGAAERHRAARAENPPAQPDGAPPQEPPPGGPPPPGPGR